MNKIYKFRKGKIIPKAQNGQRFQLAGRSTMGFPVWADTQTGRLYTSDIAGRRNPNRDWETNDWSQWTDEGTTLRYFNGLSVDYIKGKDWVKKPIVPTKENSNEIIVDGKKYASVSDWHKERAARQQPVANENKIPIVPKQPNSKVDTKRPPKDWEKEFTSFMGGLSSEQQEWLKQNGLQDATRLQEYLNNMKFDVGKFGADGKFGKDSKAAWDRFVASGIMGKNNDQEILKRKLEEQKKTEPLVDAPDPFGYKTSNTYEGNDFASKLKKMGIRSNADLINFMYKSGKEGWKGDAWQTQFRNDVDKALGGDYSDANIRKTFNTKNGWGRGFLGGGDFSDFQNALQTNAGVWNGIYDAKEQASRTGANGTVYSSPEMMRKFENIKLQSNQNNQELTSSTKFDFSNMKFNNIFTGNTGVSTLGNIPSTKPINLSQEFTKGLTSNIPSEVYKPNTSVVYKSGTSDWLDWVQ